MTNKIEFTETAKKEISRIISRDTSKKYFRISVLGGGCSGFKYNFSFEDKVQDNDRLFDQTVIDNNSLTLIPVEYSISICDKNLWCLNLFL